MYSFVAVVIVVLLVQAGWAPPADVASSAVLKVGADDVAADCGWLRPVDAEVIDAFRPPPDRFSAGNRGLEYGTIGGEPVTAVADGQVTFVGPVGGRNYVVITHADGHRSTYGPLQATSALRGHRQRRAEQVGLAAPGFHLTARIGEHYVDPQPLLDGVCSGPRLIAPQG